MVLNLRMVRSNVYCNTGLVNFEVYRTMIVMEFIATIAAIAYNFINIIDCYRLQRGLLTGVASVR